MKKGTLETIFLWKEYGFIILGLAAVWFLEDIRYKLLGLVLVIWGGDFLEDYYTERRKEVRHEQKRIHRT